MLHSLHLRDMFRISDDKKLLFIPQQIQMILESFLTCFPQVLPKFPIKNHPFAMGIFSFFFFSSHFRSRMLLFFAEFTVVNCHSKGNRPPLKEDRKCFCNKEVARWRWGHPSRGWQAWRDGPSRDSGGSLCGPLARVPVSESGEVVPWLLPREPKG